MEEVVRRNSGHNAAECKDCSMRHRERAEWVLVADDYTSAFPRTASIYSQP